MTLNEPGNESQKKNTEISRFNKAAKHAMIVLRYSAFTFIVTSYNCYDVNLQIHIYLRPKVTLHYFGVLVNDI